jgi:prephenate dehydrogenase
MKTFKQLGLIGCGLMGGSFALAAKKSGLVESVVGYSKSPQNGDLAKSMGVVDVVAASILQAAMGSDLILISVPTTATFEVFKALQFGLSADVLILDVGSTKQSVIEAATKALGTLPPNFVPSHPIAGKEQSGIEHADGALYADKRVILTPTSQTNAHHTQMAQQVWQQIGSHVSVMSASQHDAIFAAVSHAPHLLAFAFVNGLSSQSQAAEFWQFAGPGFRDFSRIAASDPDVWRDILMTNTAQILSQIKSFKSSLSHLEAAMIQGDSASVKTLITKSSQARQGWLMNRDIKA